MQTGIVFDIREFTIHDGPGIRTTVFLKGCPLRCSWCHNPEGISPQPETIRTASGQRIVGKPYTSERLAAILNRQAPVLSANEGGVTFSGGEPTAQAEFLAETIAQLKGLHVLLDTSGYAQQECFRRVASLCQLVYFDIKLVDPAEHLRHTGVDNAPILANLRTLSAIDVPFVIRVPLIPTVTDTEKNLSAIAKLASGLPGLVRVDLLSYNRAAGGKYAAVGREFKPTYDESRENIPSLDIFRNKSVPVRLAGSAPR